VAEIILSAVKTGITRLRVKGGASPDSLYDLANAYVSAARTIVPRPGSAIHMNLPAGTIGLGLFNGVFQVFSDHAISGMPEGFNLNVLSHPSPDPDDPPTLIRIWKKEPLMGGLYVVAEWSDGEVFHYWILSVSAGNWKPEKVYMLNEHVTPTVQNGLTYQAGRLLPADPVWKAGEEREVGDIVEPTTFNGYKYVVVEAYGAPPRSGDTEPAWIAKEGEIVIEEADVTSDDGEQSPPSNVPPDYNNPGGSLPNKPGGKYGNTVLF